MRLIQVFALCLSLGGCVFLPEKPFLPPEERKNQAEIEPPPNPILTALSLKVDIDAWERQKTDPAPPGSSEESHRLDDLSERLKAMGASRIVREPVPLRRFKTTGQLSLHFKGKKYPILLGRDGLARLSLGGRPVTQSACPLSDGKDAPNVDTKGRCLWMRGSGAASLNTPSNRDALCVLVLAASTEIETLDKALIEPPILRQMGKPPRLAPVIALINTDRLPTPLKTLEEVSLEDRKTLRVSFELKSEVQDFDGVNLMAYFSGPETVLMAAPLDRSGPSQAPSPATLQLIGTLQALDLAIHAPRGVSAGIQVVIYDGEPGRQLSQSLHPNLRWRERASPPFEAGQAFSWDESTTAYQQLLNSLLRNETLDRDGQGLTRELIQPMHDRL